MLLVLCYTLGLIWLAESKSRLFHKNRYDAELCYDHTCDSKKHYGDICESSKDCCEPLGLFCNNKTCVCENNVPPLGNGCPDHGNECYHNSDCPAGFYCAFECYCYKNETLNPVHQALIVFAVLLFSGMGAGVLYFALKRKANRKKWKAEKVVDDGDLSENQSSFDIDEEEADIITASQHI